MTNPVRILLPVALGLVAAVANFLALNSGPAPIELVVLARDLQRGETLAAEHFGKLAVRADAPPLLQSAVTWEKAGVVLGRRVTRAMKKGEVLFYRDAQEDAGDDVRANLRPGELARTITVATERLAANLRPGDPVGLLVAEGNRDGEGRAGVRLVGPYRLLSTGEKLATTTNDRIRHVVVAVPLGATSGRLSEVGGALEKALATRSGRNDDRVVGIELYRAKR